MADEFRKSRQKFAKKKNPIQEALKESLKDMEETFKKIQKLLMDDDETIEALKIELEYKEKIAHLRLRAAEMEVATSK